MTRRIGPILLILAAACLLALPLASPSTYVMRLVDMALIMSLLAISLNIVLGYAGLISLGHAGLFGIGAYTAGCLVMHFDLGFWPSIVLGPIVAAAFGCACTGCAPPGDAAETSHAVTAHATSDERKRLMDTIASYPRRPRRAGERNASESTVPLRGLRGRPVARTSRRRGRRSSS